MIAAFSTIPGNDHAIAALRELLLGGKVIAFVGAGASAGLYPLWNELIERLADEASKQGLAQTAECDYWKKTAITSPQDAISAIRRSLGQGRYGAALRRIFRPTMGVDGNRFTRQQALLLSLPVRGYVTTNFDLGLLEARMELHPEGCATGYTTWQDSESLSHWYSGNFEHLGDRPILFAHGVYERSETVILSAEDYKTAYSSGMYRRLFDRLWTQETLLFVGFGFSDPWFTFLTSQVLTDTFKGCPSPPRHIALVGVQEDQCYTADMRRLFESRYHCDVVFYVIRRRGADHSELCSLLESIAGPPATEHPVLSKHRQTFESEPLPQKWVHETTNDDRYVERESTLAKMDRWAMDSRVHVIAITGLGGLGKTSLIGYWVRKRSVIPQLRPVIGLFYWSFYADRSADQFIDALIAFGKADLGISFENKCGSPIDCAIELTTKYPLLIILDGLEILQQEPGHLPYGTFLDDTLRELIDSACRSDRGGLVILTSRFPFADVTQHLGNTFRALDLESLTPGEGAELLRVSGVGGTDGDRQQVSKLLDGHPLALRIFAVTLKSVAHGDPTRLVEVVFDKPFLREEYPLERKLRHLLSFYEERLPKERALLLGLVSLFRTPVEEATIRMLARKCSAEDRDFESLEDVVLSRELKELCNDRLLIVESNSPDMYSCHPVLRDHFRASLLHRSGGVAQDAADLLAGRPAAAHPKNVRELQPIISAVELLLEAGNVRRAMELYLRMNAPQIFYTLPAPAEGLRITLKFVEGNGVRALVVEQIGERFVGTMLCAAAIMASMAGETHVAAQYFSEAITVFESIDEREDILITRRSYAYLLRSMGRCVHARRMAKEALVLAVKRPPSIHEEFKALTVLGSIAIIEGKRFEAENCFERCMAIRRQHGSPRGGVTSVEGVRHAEFLLRVGNVASAIEATRFNLAESHRNNFQEDAARCNSLLGDALTILNECEEAERCLIDAESVMRQGHMLSELPRVLIRVGRLRLKQRKWDEATIAIEESLRLSAPRELLLEHCDGLVLRGQLAIQRVAAEDSIPPRIRESHCFRAQDDAEAAISLSRRCGYIWGEYDALTLFIECCSIVGDSQRIPPAEKMLASVKGFLKTGGSSGDNDRKSSRDRKKNERVEKKQQRKRRR